MNYKYLALAKDNTLVQGFIEAGSDGLVEERLLRDGLKVVSLQPHLEGGIFKGFLPQASKVSHKELIIFSQQLAILLRAGTPLLSALHLLRDQARSRAFKATLEALFVDLRGGLSLHASMEKFPQSFPQVYVRLVDAGERSGTLETILQHLAAYLQREASAVQQAKKALTYPAIVAGVGVVVMGILLTVVLPTMASMLSRLHTDLPLLTRMVIGLSTAIQTYKYAVLLFLLAATLASALYLRRPQGKLELGRLIIATPWIGRLTVRRDLARFSRATSLLLAAGLPVPDCLSLARDSSSNPHFRAGITDVREQVMQGRSLAQALGMQPFIPSLYAQMVRAGEESGILEGNLASMAELYEREVDDTLATATSFLEPAITVVMGVVIGLIALSVLLPMFSLLNAIKPH